MAVDRVRYADLLIHFVFIIFARPVSVCVCAMVHLGNSVWHEIRHLIFLPPPNAGKRIRRRAWVGGWLMLDGWHNHTITWPAAAM